MYTLKFSFISNWLCGPNFLHDRLRWRQGDVTRTLLELRAAIILRLQLQLCLAAQLRVLLQLLDGVRLFWVGYLRHLAYERRAPERSGVLVYVLQATCE